MSGKRRLPLLKTDVADDGVEPPSWQWMAFGAAGIFVAWLPLSAAALALASGVVGRAAGDGNVHLVRAAVEIGVIYAMAIAMGAGAGGFVVARWGSSSLDARHAALSGLIAAVVAILLSWVSFGFAGRSLFVAAVAVPSAAVGGALGRRQRTG
jgi:hypothetical protein